MDSRIGLDYIVENKEYTAKLGSGGTLFETLQIVFFVKFYKFLGKKFEAYWLQWRLKSNLWSFQNLQPGC